MMVIGVGCAPGLVTVQAMKAIRNAKRLAGSHRALELVAEYISEGCEVTYLTAFAHLGSLPEGTVLLSTGDPMLAGLGCTVPDAQVLPGISSMQLASARLGIPEERLSVVSAHGRPDQASAIERSVEEVERGRAVFLVADPGFSVDRLAAVLMAKGIDCRIALCEALGYPEERIVFGDPSHPPSPRGQMFVVVVGRW
ncbi:MAG TPA: cobalt-precorrin-7 (C(5))-methyltransferase [Methanomassiliicoccales archaeon]|nr:cobalt-precorrin-7 (C(5))-methyltransferase [Methanomassiliicoccales archaeon]